MPDLTSRHSVEVQLETRVTRLAEKVDFLLSLDTDRWATTAWLVDEINKIKNNHEELTQAVTELKETKIEIGQRLGVFSSYVIKKLKDINVRLDCHDEKINELATRVGKLTIK